MTRLQIYTQTESGPSIEFRMSCEKCNYLKNQEVIFGPSDFDVYYEYRCSKLNRKLETITTPSDCPLLDITKVNVILNAIENYVKV